MKAGGIIALLFLTAFLQAQEDTGQNSVFAPLETIITDLNSDSVNDTIILNKKPIDGKPGLFTKMNVSVNGRRTTLYAKSSWHGISGEFAKAKKIQLPLNSLTSIKKKTCPIFSCLGTLMPQAGKKY